MQDLRAATGAVRGPVGGDKGCPSRLAGSPAKRGSAGALHGDGCSACRASVRSPITAATARQGRPAAPAGVRVFARYVRRRAQGRPDKPADARLFATGGFLGVKQQARWAPADEPSMSRDHVPAALPRQHGRALADRDWLRRHNVDRIERGSRARSPSHITDPDARAIQEPPGRFYSPGSRAWTRGAAGLQPAGRHRRPLLCHRRLRQPQHRVPAVPARHGDAAGHRRRHRRLPRRTTTARPRSRTSCRRGCRTC